MYAAVRAVLWAAEPETLEFRRVSKNTEEATGYWVERWLKELDFWKKHTPEEDWEGVRRACAEVVRTGERRQFDARMIKADGTVRWFEFNVEKRRLQTGRPELIGSMVDITERKRTEEAAKKLSAGLVRLQEEERTRVSGEIDSHIVVGLAVARLRLGTLDHEGSSLEEVERQTLRDCDELVRDCMERMQALSMTLRPPFLEEHDLAAALRWYADVYASW